MTTTVIDVENLYRRLSTFRRSGLHFECQRHYEADLDLFEQWRRGDLTTMVGANEHYDAWYNLIRGHVAASRAIRRVRILDEPPTPYQAFEVWLSRWNVASGEDIRNLNRSDAERHGILPAISDLWILDESDLVVLPWSPTGILGQITVTDNPKRVAEARHWFGVAFDAGVPHDYGTEEAA